MKFAAILVPLLLAAPLAPAALIGFWNQNETSGNIIDSTGNHPQGIATGVPTYGAPGVPNGIYGSIVVTNAAGTSMDYGPSTVDEYFTIGTDTVNPAMSLLNTSAFTVMSWINPNALSGLTAATYRPLSTGSITGVDRGWGFGLRLNNAAGTGSAVRFTTYGVADNDSSLFDITPGSWIHIAATYNNGAINYFLNGSPLDSDTSTFGAIGTANRLTIGSRLGGADADQINGRVDGIQIYDSILTAGQIQAAAAGSVSVPEPSAVLSILAGGLGLLLRRRGR